VGNTKEGRVFTRSALSIVTATALTALITLCLGWELWIAPLRAGGSMLALKALPLLIPLFGVLRERRYTYQWTSMLVLAYLAEGSVRAFTESGITRMLALTEIALACTCFCLAIMFTRTIHVPGENAAK
jgi:uncharacterized membrane protein